MRISKQLENREVPLCVVCKENPQREGCKTCSTECSKAYRKAYQKTDKYKAYQKAYHKAYQKACGELINKHRKEFEKLKDEKENE